MRRIGVPLHRLRETTSTNDEAKKLASEGAPEGTVVTADVQTAGRGRRGRTWMSPAGNLYLSVILRPKIAPAAAPPLAPAMGLAVALAIEEVAPLSARIKWPNDVMVSDRKVAGILVESMLSGSTLDAVIVGIGVNVGSELPAEIAEIATTLSREAVRNVRKSEIEEALLTSMSAVYRRFLEGGFAALAEEWNERDWLLGRPVSIAGADHTVTGKGGGIDPDGALRVETGRDLALITTGEVL